VPIILIANGEKMSIKDDGASVKWLLEEGFLPEAILNYLISIGNETPQEIFKLQDALEWFNLDTISNSPTRFDMDRLKHINRAHLKNFDTKELSRYVGFADSEIGELARVYLEEAATTKELKSRIESIFAPKIIPEAFAKQAKIMSEAIKSAPYFKEYDDFENYLIKETSFKDEDFSKPLRLLLTGAEHGPDIAEIYKHLKNYIGEIVK